MAKAKRRKKSRKLTGNMQRKLILMFALVLAALVLLNVRLVYINAASGDKYTKKVLSQKKYQSKTIPFRRGAIKDINGEVLATSEKVYYLILDCKVLNTLEEEKNENKTYRTDVQNATIRALCQYFEELDDATLRGYLRDKADSAYIRILKEIPHDRMKGFQKLIEKKDSMIKGVWFEETYIRKYPNDYLASNLIGFTLSGNAGNWGIEEYYNDELNGMEGRTYGYLNGDSNMEKTTMAAVDGHNVILNLNAGVQKIVEKHVTAFNEEHRNEATQGLGSKNTAVLVMNPKTGAVIASSVYPYYNLNKPRDLTYLGQFTQAEVDAMTSEELQTNLSTIWRNFVVSDTYEPGSTFKPFTVAMGLESGALTGNETYYCDGYEIIENTRVKCSHTSGHGSLTFSEAIAKSCNDALMQMSYKIGAEEFVKYQGIFGFGKKTGVDVKGEVNAAGLLYNEDNITPLSLGVNSFGQNFNVTMMQMMSGFCALVNGGNYYQPQVANRIENTDGEIIRQFQPKLLKQVISRETSELIRGYLLGVVDGGTAPSAQVDGYRIGGKTGTAEKFPRGQGKYLVSFIGCAPIEDPEIVVYVIIDEPNVENQASSLLAVRLFHDIMAEILPYLNITSIEDSNRTSMTVDIDWSVEGDEVWQEDMSFLNEGENVTPPDGEYSEYYEDGDTGSTADDGENTE